MRTLIAAKAPLDHVNNLGWTALIESIVLGDGGKRHTATLKAIVDAGANVNMADRAGDMPLALAKKRGYRKWKNSSSGAAPVRPVSMKSRQLIGQFFGHAFRDTVAVNT